MNFTQKTILTICVASTLICSNFAQNDLGLVVPTEKTVTTKQLLLNHYFGLHKKIKSKLKKYKINRQKAALITTGAITITYGLIYTVHQFYKSSSFLSTIATGNTQDTHKWKEEEFGNHPQLNQNNQKKIEYQLDIESERIEFLKSFSPPQDLAEFLDNNPDKNAPGNIILNKYIAKGDFATNHRTINAEKMRTIFTTHRIKHFSVPQKYIYQTESNDNLFKHAQWLTKCKKDTTNLDQEITELKKTGWGLTEYADFITSDTDAWCMNIDQVKELEIVLQHTGFNDFKGRNIIKHNNVYYFIDTEDWSFKGYKGILNEGTIVQPEALYDVARFRGLMTPEASTYIMNRIKEKDATFYQKCINYDQQYP